MFAGFAVGDLSLAIAQPEPAAVSYTFACRIRDAGLRFIGIIVPHQIGDGCGVKFFVKNPGSLLPCEPYPTVVGHGTCIRITDAFNQIALAFKQPDDLTQSDLFRFFDQQMAAFGASDTGYQIRLF